MISNKAVVRLETDKIAIEPVFKDRTNNVIPWFQALTTYQAKATWSNLENAESYGIFTIDASGRGYFVPHRAGRFVVNCLVVYTDLVTGDPVEINQDLTVITTQKDDGNCTCEVEISNKDNNIITMEEDGLYAPSQDGTVVSRIAGETMSALLAVYELDGKVFKLDYRDGEHITLLTGLTNSAADVNGSVVVHVSGVIDDSSFNWQLGRVYIGVGGRLTQEPPQTGYLLCIGSAVSRTRLNINIQDPIKLE